MIKVRINKDLKEIIRAGTENRTRVVASTGPQDGPLPYPGHRGLVLQIEATYRRSFFI